MTVDIGTGDGGYVLARASAMPAELVVGVDASAAAMAGASRRAARAARKGGLPNAIFVVAAAEALAPELDGFADLVTVQFPWGSLLRGAAGAQQEISVRVAALLKAGGTLRLLLSASPRDVGAGVAELDLAAIADSWRSHGLRAVTCRPASPEELAAAHSSWAKRLRNDPHRSTWFFELVKPL